MNIRTRDLKRYFCVLDVPTEIPYTYYVNDDVLETVSTEFYFGNKPKTTIPTMLDGKSVTGIGATTFCLKTYVNDVTIGNNIVSID